MKKYFYSLLAATGLLLATSCSQDDLVNETGSESKVVTFKVNLPDQATSRAVGDGTKATELIFAMYEEDSNTPLIRKKISDTDDGNNTADGKFTVSVPMAKDIKYDLLFLAYNPGNCAFNIASDPEDTDLKALSFKNKLTANLDAYDAFVGVKKSQGITASGANSVTLTRPFAQVNAATSDKDDAALLKSTVTTSEFRIYGVPSTYNVFKKEATGTMDVVFEKSAIPANETIIKDDKTYNYLTLAYVLAGGVEQASTHKAEFLFYREDGKQVSSLYFENFPIQRNYRTNVLGNLLTQVEDYTVTIHKGFEGTHSANPNEANRVYTVTDEDGWKEVAAILESSGEDTISVKLGAGMGRAASNVIVASEKTVINKDKTVFLDLNGYTLSLEYNQTEAYSLIENNGTLTISDAVGDGKISYSDTGNGGNYGSNTILNNGTLTIESGIIENNSSDDVYENGYPHPIDNNAKLIINGGTITNNSKYSSIRIWCTTDDNTEVTINGGTFEGSIDFHNVNGNANKGILTIKDGTFNADTYTKTTVRLLGFGLDVDEMTAYIKGGVFNGKIALNNYIGSDEFNSKVFAVTGGTFNDASVLNYLADGANIKFGKNIEAGSNTYTIPTGVSATLDLNGYILSGTCNAGQGHLIMVENGAVLNIKDSKGNGKITYAEGTSNVGWTIDLEGELNLYSGTIELTGDWSIGYAVDVRPNAWGTEYTEPTTFHMYGGKLVSSDGAVRVASSSSDSYENVSANFIMDGGEIDAAWDGIFIQQSNAVHDNLNVVINDGKITSALSPIRLYGPVATDYVGDDEKPAKLTINGGEFNLKGEADESRIWLIKNLLIGAGGADANWPNYAEINFNGGTFNEISILNYLGSEANIDLKLSADATVDATLTVPAKATVNLDLNGYDLNYAVENTKASAIISNKGMLNISNTATQEATISFVAANPDMQEIPAYATNTISNTGTLTIGENVKVTNESDGGASYAVDNHGIFTLNGGTLIGKRCALRVARYNQDNVHFTMNSGLVQAATPAWIQLPGSNAADAPKITVDIKGGIMKSTNESSADNNVMYTYSFGNSHANTIINISGGEFIGGTVSIGSGYKGDAPSLSITGGTFDYNVLQWLENDESKVLYEANAGNQ